MLDDGQYIKERYRWFEGIIGSLQKMGELKEKTVNLMHLNF